METPDNSPETPATSDPKSITKVLEGEKSVSYADKPTPQEVPFHVAETKQARKDLDGILQTIKNSPRKGRERSLVITKIEEAIMWLGKDLQAQNEANPYPESKNPESPVIHPVADGLKH